MIEHVKFPKIPRPGKERILITEKLDGTNGLIYIDIAEQEFLIGSRNRWITPEEDNFGFARWAMENKEELLKLGSGYHYGEWYGAGIQRGYGLDEKRFALFDVLRWGPHNPNTPRCCEVVTILGGDIDDVMLLLSKEGSKHISGFDKPEGACILDLRHKTYTKVTFENSEGKWSIK